MTKQICCGTGQGQDSIPHFTPEQPCNWDTTSVGPGSPSGFIIFEHVIESLCAETCRETEVHRQHEGFAGPAHPSKAGLEQGDETSFLT